MSQTSPQQPGFTLSHAYDNTKEGEEPHNADTCDPFLYSQTQTALNIHIFI